MKNERSVLDELMPGLDGKLAAHDRGELEAPGSPGLDLFKAAGGPGLLVDTANSGLGATAVQAVAVQKALGARSGSLAVGTTMHHFSLASLLAMARVSSSGLETLLVGAIASEGHLLASGFAEGRPGAGILSPSMVARPVEGGVRVSGVKRPCSLARSMTMLTASVELAGADGPELAVVLVPSGTPGLRVEPFWRSPVLAGAESEAVILDDVFVPDQLVVKTSMAAGGGLDTTHRIGFLWFELLMTASYLGIAAGLVEEALAARSAPDGTVVAALAQIQTTTQALTEVAVQLDAHRSDDELLGHLLLTRFQLQEALPALTAGCLESIGGMAFITSPELANRAASLSCLAFHPPSRNRSVGALRALHDGAPLTFD